MDGGADLRRCVAPGRLGTLLERRSSMAGPRRMAFPRWHQRPGAPQGRRRGQKGDTSAQHDAHEALGRSRGGYRTKACVIADALRRAIGFALAPGQGARIAAELAAPDPPLPRPAPGSWPEAVATPAAPFATAFGASAPSRSGDPPRPSATRRAGAFVRRGSTRTRGSASSASGLRLRGVACGRAHRRPRAPLRVLSWLPWTDSAAQTRARP